MRVVVAGSTGLLGSALVGTLRARDHDVVRLVRREPGAADESRWDPYRGEIDTDLVQKADVVVNLAGAPNVGNPFSKKWSRELERSRITTTRLLAQTVARASSTPAFLAGTGTSAYGDHGTAVVTEESPDRGGDALLARVVRSWEAAAAPAREAGARLCLLRTSPVLHRRNVPLQQLRPLFRLGLGGRVGRGEQYFPMISLEDWVGAATWLIEHDGLAGPFNMCCPVTPTHREFVDALARHLHRPAWFVVPSGVLSVAMGPLAPEVVNSVNLRPAALLSAGYEFRHRDVTAVIASALDGPH